MLMIERDEASPRGHSSAWPHLPGSWNPLCDRSYKNTGRINANSLGNISRLSEVVVVENPSADSSAGSEYAPAL
jgi:hypothetical protein